MNNNFPYVRVIPVSNGTSWSVERMCAVIVTNYRALNMLYDHVIVWFDRERRSETSAQIRSSVRTALLGEGVLESSLHVGIPDLSSENWILADERLIREFLGEATYSYSHEGTSGLSVLKDLYKSSGRNYKKTRDGVNLLKRLRLPRAAVASASAQELMSTWSVDCWWTTTHD